MIILIYTTYLIIKNLEESENHDFPENHLYGDVLENHDLSKIWRNRKIMIFRKITSVCLRPKSRAAKAGGRTVLNQKLTGLE